MASTDAKPIPQKNVAYRVTFPIFDADGDLVTGATGLDSEISKDGGTFADCTNEATEIATASGMYFLDLTATEMNADTVAVIIKTSTSGAKTTPIVMYPEEVGDIRVNVTAYGGTAGTFASGRPEVNTTHVSGTAQTAGDIIADTNDIQTRIPAALVSGRMDSSVGAMATDVLTSTALAASAVTEIQSGLSTLTSANVADAVWNAATASYGSAGTYGLVVETNLDAAISSRMATYTQPTGFLAATFPSGTIANTTNITAGTITTATNVTTVNGLAANVITAAATAADFGAEIADAVLDEVVEGTTTLRQSMRLANSANAGKTAGMETTTGTIRDLADTKNRVSATLDGNGNRTAVTIDVT